MRGVRLAVALFVFSLFPYFVCGQRVEGIVVDTLGRGVGAAEISLAGGSRPVAITNGEGMFKFVVSQCDSVCFTVSALGYHPVARCVKMEARESVQVRVVLEEREIAIEGVGVGGKASPYATMQRIDVEDLLKLQGTSGGVESLVKLMPGVHSSNELSSQYSVRGGSYDENLVYIDGVEVYRPQLARSGSQEGMPIVNPDMVSAIEFSSGAFPASYGDKLSSVLNVRYRTPRRFGARVDLSLMENRAYVEGATNDQRVSGMLGVRYKTTRLLLNTTETKGDYLPSYLDIQGKGMWTVRPNLDISMLMGFSRNQYDFKPHKKVTRFGALTADFLQMNVYYEGQERDSYMTYFGTLQTEWRATPAFTLRGQLGAYWMREEERFDILSEYWLAELRSVDEVKPIVDSASNVGIGGFLEHARNRFEGVMATARGVADYRFSLGSVEGGVEVLPRYFQHATSEWHIVDSAGYAMPLTHGGVPVQDFAKGSGEIPSVLYSAYVQTTLRFSFSFGEMTTVFGVRGSGMDRFQNLRVSPRLSVSFVPDGARNVRVYAGGGLYYQYPFYREMRDRSGRVHGGLKPQRSIHALGGVQWSFLIAESPFKLQAECYAKWGGDLIPYTIDNVRLRYEAQNAAKSRTYGMDVKVNGELAPDVESWLSLSVMRSRMRIVNQLYDLSRQPFDESYFLGPQDQLFSGALFLQDYLPGVPGFRVSLQGNYALGVPFTPPNGRYGQQARMPSYKRVDIGFSYAFKDSNYCIRWLSNAQWLKSLVLSVEVLNLLNFSNTVSYMWLKVQSPRGNSSLMAVPNYLTSRCVNVRLVMSL